MNKDTTPAVNASRHTPEKLDWNDERRRMERGNKAKHSLPHVTMAGNAIKSALELAHRTEADSRPINPAAICHALWDAQAEIVETAAQIAALREALERAEKQLAVAFNPSDSPILELCRSEAQLSCNQIRAALGKAKS